MKRLSLLASLLCFGTGCMSLDFMFLGGETVDRYELHDDVIPAELVELVAFKRADGVVLKGVWAHQPNPAPPMIYFHGNGSSIQTQWDRMGHYWSWGTHDVFIVDYAGYGASEGVTTWKGLAELDGPATVDYVVAETGYAPEEIPWVALSLGGFVSLKTNEQIAAQSILIESVFSDSDSLVDDSLKLDTPNGWFFRSDWDNVDNITRIQSPIFVIHGLADDFILPESGPRLHAAAPTDKQLWQPEGVGHSDLWEVAPEEFQRRATEWISRWAQSPPD
ncbi:MAG: hypothetical protein GWP91_20370 [Rhodobacterales bacterium]|nr:hypothetical protein [Rhodobacterales bacterium]